LLASHPCVQVKFKATEKRNVCLRDAADVVPIADARMRWPGVSSNSEWESVAGVCWNTTERLEITKSCEMMAWARQGEPSSKPQKVGPT
jgi:hypothetical protein